jgi:hypothetical protein
VRFIKQTRARRAVRNDGQSRETAPLWVNLSRHCAQRSLKRLRYTIQTQKCVCTPPRSKGTAAASISEDEAEVFCFALSESSSVAAIDAANLTGMRTGSCDGTAGTSPGVRHWQITGTCDSVREAACAQQAQRPQHFAEQQLVGSADGAC